MTDKSDKIFARIRAAQKRRSQFIGAEKLSDRMIGSDKQKLAEMEQIIEVLRQRLRENDLSDKVR
jgi:hypothetical protein